MRTLYLKGKDLGRFAEACLTLSPRVFLLEESVSSSASFKMVPGQESRMRPSGGVLPVRRSEDESDDAAIGPFSKTPTQELFIDLTPTLKFFKGEENWIAQFERLRESFSITQPYVVTDRIEWAKAFYIALDLAAAVPVSPETNKPSRSRASSSAPFKMAPSSSPSDRAKQSMARTHKRGDAGDLDKVVEETERGGRSHSAVAAGPRGVLPVRRSENEPDDAADGVFSMAPLILPEGKSRELLLQLPIERLMAVGNPRLLPAESQDRLYLVSFMRRVGLNSISDFVRLDAPAISRRFGKLGLQIREWLEGEKEVSLPTYIPHEPIKEFIDAEEIGSMEALLLNLVAPFERISQRLLGRGKAVRSILLWFQFDGGGSHRELLQFHEPHREPARFLKMVEEYLHRCQWENPLTFLEIEICECVTFTSGQLSLFDTTENRMSDLGHYVLTWRDRFGDHAVGFADLKASYVPERSWQKVWPPQTTTRSDRPFLGLRPPILYSPPKPYEVHRNLKLVASEHLASEWWEEEGAYRRYFIAEPPQGKRLWIFWDYQKQQWFLQGSFD